MGARNQEEAEDLTSKNPFDSAIRDYEEILDNKKPLPNGKFYSELDEAEKKRLNKLLDMARIAGKALGEGKPMSSQEEEFFLETAKEGMLLNREAFANLSEEEKDKQWKEYEASLTKLEAVFGKEYVDSLRKRMAPLRKAKPSGLEKNLGD